jgi:hypothetical protein
MDFLLHEIEKQFLPFVFRRWHPRLIIKFLRCSSTCWKTFT